MQKLDLVDFSEKKVENLYSIKGGEGVETGGGAYFFGYGTSTCDWDPGDGGDWTYYFDDPERWRLVAGPIR